jgi:UDP-N-acetylglucosamine--N-acetylmuramyl-(pentapeptide) pyrophosphoryl-undecaprenol N-acetylglucosamine transferase
VKKIVIATGGSGGHLLPAQQLAEQLKAEPGTSVVFGGYKLRESPFFHRDLYQFVEIASSQKLSRPLPLLRGVFQAVRFLLREKPDVVVGFGSYHSAPLLLAAALLRKKIVLYEANRTMGKVNRWIAPFATVIGCQFPLSDYTSPKVAAVPLLPWGIAKVKTARADAKKAFGLTPDRFTLLVFGGSQGAAFLNEVMPKVVNQMENVQVIHSAGTESAADGVRAAYRVPAVVKTFETNMAMAYSAADFAVCRSGAGTVAELIRYAVPALLIPYPHATDQHQQKNSDYLTEQGGSLSLKQTEATTEAILQKIQSADRAAMQEALGSLAMKNTTLQQLYERILKL